MARIESENGYRSRSWLQTGISVGTVVVLISVAWGIFSERVSNLRTTDIELRSEIQSVKTEGSKPTTDNTLQIEVLKKSVANLEDSIKRIESKQLSIDSKLDAIAATQALILLKIETHMAKEAGKP
jgi:predicted  nucleic acid-binding Zn-ribbon protein